MDRLEVIDLFRSQLGVASAGQLEALGVSASTIGRARRRGVLRVVIGDLVCPTDQPLRDEGRLMAAQLWCGPTSYVTSTTAGWLYGLREMPRQPVRIGVRERVRGAGAPWLAITRRAGLGDDEITTRPDGLRVVTPHALLLALAGDLDDRRFSRAAEDAWHRQLITPASVADYLRVARRPGRRGVARLDRWLGESAPRVRPAQSGFELDVIEVLVAIGLPDPHRQHPLRLADGQLIHLDIAWPELRLAVEPGHTWWHGGDAAMRADAARDRACGRLGWLVLRYDEESRQNLRRLAREVRAIFETRRRQLRGHDPVICDSLPARARES